MTLGRLILAWLPVAALFAVAPPLGYRWGGGGALPPDQRALVWSFNLWEICWRLVEAAVVTLFASLWFDTLGAGGWWVLFLLVKERTTTGYVEVSVHSGDLYHKTQIPVADPMQVQQIRQLVGQAQTLATRAR